MLSFENIHGANGPTSSIFRPFDNDENGEEDIDEFFHQPEKKRRLTANQVQFLEKSFEVENKLEPERKVQLAKDLGLQPRQVAIWFQNRRARWKTKQLEKDYDALQANYDALKSDFENLLKERDALESEVLVLKDRLLRKDKEESENPKLPVVLSQEPTEPVLASSSDGEVSEVPILVSKQDDICSAKSDIIDSDSPHFTGHSSHLEPADSSYAFEPEQSDLSQDEEDVPSKNFLSVFPKLESSDYQENPPASSCHFGFHTGDQDHAFWSWSY
ncbi:hypothetical protein CDL15_Pgr008924 [Punica granatum]|nr:hypothetical protein CDL15_Pgr008924 [Punica granatum]PKI63201.1 hypothetical protein CRG98_016386 [Punica granatum]